MLLVCVPNGTNFPVDFSPWRLLPYHHYKAIGPLHDPFIWYGTNYAGMQITQRDNLVPRAFSPILSAFKTKELVAVQPDFPVCFESPNAVPLRYLRPSIIYSAPLM